ncbi:MAG: glycosyltransferase family 4 protein [Burkholderiaceae bacterium]
MNPSTPSHKHLVIVTDAWHPQVNGVVRTLMNTSREIQAMGYKVSMITPEAFRSVPCPSYPEIRLALTTSRTIEAKIEALAPDALHIATEGPLGWAARAAARRRGWQFTTAFHTRFPEYVNARTGIPVSWLYALFRHFHSPSKAVLAPTKAIIDDLNKWRFGNVTYWSRGVDHGIFFPRCEQTRPNPERPIFIYVGRLAVEKNIEAFLSLELPGEKWVAGEGPLEATLKARYPSVNWIGVLPQDKLAEVYSQADVFVFPSLTDTFGLVMVEAMACGLRVAAYPVAGPIDVVGTSKAGVLSNDLLQACLACLEIPREAALERAAQFTWQAATEQFEAALVPMVPN